jgi:hypothetical protein
MSTIAQVMGTVGLILVPIGALWIMGERVERFARLRFTLRLIALMTASFVWAVAVLAAAVQGGFVLGAITLAFGVYVARRVWASFKRPFTLEGSGALPLYLVVVPAVAALLQRAAIDEAVAFSRNRAIRNSAPLLAAIEQYRAMHGRYPESLLSVNPDYWPGVIGISMYHYEPHRDAYNLFFEQFSYRLGTREFVMYNPRDEHVMTSHGMDLLELTPEQLALERTRGHYAVHDTPHRHWRYFWFD